MTVFYIKHYHNSGMSYLKLSFSLPSYRRIWKHQHSYSRWLVLWKGLLIEMKLLGSMFWILKRSHKNDMPKLFLSLHNIKSLMLICVIIKKHIRRFHGYRYLRRWYHCRGCNRRAGGSHTDYPPCLLPRLAEKIWWRIL